MAFEIQRAPPPPERKHQEKLRFPSKAYLLALFVMTGLFYYLIFVVPKPGADESSWAARKLLELGRLSESHPLILGGVLAGLLVPPLLFRVSARKYLFRLTAILALLWIGGFVVTSRVNAEAKVNAFLDNDRHLPQTIHGREKPGAEVAD